MLAEHQPVIVVAVVGVGGAVAAVALRAPATSRWYIKLVAKGAAQGTLARHNWRLVALSQVDRKDLERMERIYYNK